MIGEWMIRPDADTPAPHRRDSMCIRHDCRPVVVIDPEDREQVRRLGQSLLAHEDMQRATTENVQAALRSLIAPPKPDEPTGLGAVVEDSEGHLHVRTGRDYAPWVGGRYNPSIGRGRPWSDIDAVRVLSDGVQP